MLLPVSGVKVAWASSGCHLPGKELWGQLDGSDPTPAEDSKLAQ